MVNIGVIGYGYWGPNLVRNCMEIPETRVLWVSDLSKKRLELVQSRYPTIQVSTSARDLFKCKEVDAIAIATPVSTHYDLARQALKAGKHILVEKPLADNSRKCLQLLQEAKKQKKIIMVDHTFPFTGAVRKIKELIHSGELGEIYYYDSVRVNLGLFQHDVSVIWDLAVHDLSILDYILKDKPVAVSATGISHVKGQPEDVAYLTLFFKGNTIAHIHVNWLAPVKVRETLIGGNRKMIVYDDLEPTEKIKIYDTGVTVETNPENIYQMKIGYRTGDMLAPKLDGTEALKAMIRHFAQCVQTGETPITDGQCGTRIVQIMEAATKSMAKHGQLVKLT